MAESEAPSPKPCQMAQLRGRGLDLQSPPRAPLARDQVDAAGVGDRGEWAAGKVRKPAVTEKHVVTPVAIDVARHASGDAGYPSHVVLGNQRVGE